MWQNNNLPFWPWYMNFYCILGTSGIIWLAIKLDFFYFLAEVCACFVLRGYMETTHKNVFFPGVLFLAHHRFQNLTWAFFPLKTSVWSACKDGHHPCWNWKPILAGIPRMCLETEMVIQTGSGLWRLFHWGQSSRTKQRCHDVWEVLCLKHKRDFLQNRLLHVHRTAAAEGRKERW